MPDPRLTGVVTSVRARLVGTALVQPAAAGDTVLQVLDNAVFRAGDVVALTDPETQTTTLVAVGDVQGEDVLVLAVPAVVAWPVDTIVTLTPVATEVTAFVRLNADSEPVPCRVAHALGDALEVGLRDETTAETVALDRVDGQLHVVDVLARQTTRPDLAADVAGKADATVRVDYAPTDEPAPDGRQWFQTNETGQVLGWWIGDGTDWIQQEITGVMLAVDALDGKTITGALFRTSALTTVDRVLLDELGLRVINAADLERINLSPDGFINLYGNDTGGGTLNSWGTNRFAQMTGGRFMARVLTPGGFDYPVVYLQPNRLQFLGPPVGGFSPSQTISRNPANEGLYLETSDGPMVLQPNGGMFITPFLDDPVVIETNGTAGIRLNATGSGPIELGVAGAIGDVRSTRIFEMTTGDGANLRMDSGGIFRRVSSTIRRKTDIQPMDVSDLVVWGDGTEDNPGIQGVTFFDIPALARHAENPESEPEPRAIPGLIAEWLEAVGLSMLVDYNEDGQPESLMYDRVLPVMLPAFKRDHERIQDLQAENVELRADVAELKAQVAQLLAQNS